jgi:hypothetical protein
LCDYKADELGKNSYPVLDNGTLILSCGTVWCHIHSCKELISCFMFGMNLIFDMSDRSFLTNFVRLVFSLITTSQAHIQGVWLLLKCETNWLHYRPGILTLLHIVSSHSFCSERNLTIFKCLFCKKFNVLLIWTFLFCDLVSHPTVVAHQLRNTTISVWLAPLPLYVFMGWCFGTRLS